MFFLGGMEKNLPLLSSVCKMSVGKRCPGQHVHVPSLLTFEYKHAWEVTKCRNPMKTLLFSSSCLCFMAACLVAGPYRGWRTMMRTRRESALGNHVLGWGTAGSEWVLLSGRELPRSLVGYFALASGPSDKEALPAPLSGVCLCTCECSEGIWSLGGVSLEFWCRLDKAVLMRFWVV